MKRPETFQQWTEILISWLNQWADEEGWLLPSWSTVLVTDEENGRRSATSIPAVDFEARFREVLQQTTRSWVNLHVDRIEHDTLYLVIEFISRDDAGAVKVAPDRISVNMSGPERSWLETLSSRALDD